MTTHCNLPHHLSLCLCGFVVSSAPTHSAHPRCLPIITSLLPTDTCHFPVVSYYWSSLSMMALVVHTCILCWRFHHSAFTLLLPAYYFKACRWYLFVGRNSILALRRAKQGAALQMAYPVLFWHTHRARCSFANCLPCFVLTEGT